MKNILIKHKNLIPLLILCLFSLYTIYQVFFMQYEAYNGWHSFVFSIENYLAFAFLILDIVIYFYFRKYFKYAVVITVFLGFWGILNYHITLTKITVFITFERTSFFLAITYFLLNRQRAMKKLFGKPINEETRIPDQEKIDGFKLKYANKTSFELNEIMNDNRFTIESKIAAKEMLDNRN